MSSFQSLVIKNKKKKNIISQLIFHSYIMYDKKKIPIGLKHNFLVKVVSYAIN